MGTANGAVLAGVCVAALALLLAPPSALAQDGAASCDQLSSTNIEQTMNQLNTVCCNGGDASADGHRRVQAGTCVLDTCSLDCADLFVPLFKTCGTQMEVLARPTPPPAPSPAPSPAPRPSPRSQIVHVY